MASGMAPLSAIVACLLLIVWIPSSNQEDVTDTPEVCIRTVDLMFVLDGSNSLGSQDFSIMVQTVGQASATLSFGPDQARAGAVLYSSQVEAVIPLQTDLDIFTSLVTSLPYPDDRTATHLGIDQARRVLEDIPPREDTPKVILVITDGVSDNPSATQTAALWARSRGIDLWAVGIGSEVNVTELTAIASKDGDKTFFIPSFAELSTHLVDVTRLVCHNAEMLSTFTPPFTIVTTGRSSSPSSSTTEGLATTHSVPPTAVSNTEGIASTASVTPSFWSSPTPESSKSTIFSTRRSTFNTDLTHTPRTSMTDNSSTKFSSSSTPVSSPDTTTSYKTSSPLTRRTRPWSLSSTATASPSSFSPDSQTSVAGSTTSAPSSSFTVSHSSLPSRLPTTSTVTSSPVYTSSPPSSSTSSSIDISSQSSATRTFSEPSTFTSSSSPSISQNTPTSKSISSTSQLSTYSSQPAAQSTTLSSTLPHTTITSRHSSMAVSTPQESSSSTRNPVTTTWEITDDRAFSPSQDPDFSYSVPTSHNSDPTTSTRSGSPTSSSHSPTSTQSKSTPPSTLPTVTSSPRSSSSGESSPGLTSSTVPAQTSATPSPTPLEPGPTPPTILEICRDKVNKRARVHLVRHPGNCQLFIQCYFNPLTNRTLAVTRHCPFGQFWDQEKLTCVASWLVDCPFDKCRTPCKEDASLLKMDGTWTYTLKENGCGSYWACQNGKSVQKCCPNNFAYSPQIGCTLDFSCADCHKDTERNTCSHGQGPCRRIPEWSTMDSYLLTTRLVGPTRRFCYGGQGFNVHECACATTGYNHTSDCEPHFGTILDACYDHEKPLMIYKSDTSVDVVAYKFWLDVSMPGTEINITSVLCKAKDEDKIRLWQNGNELHAELSSKWARQPQLTAFLDRNSTDPAEVTIQYQAGTMTLSVVQGSVQHVTSRDIGGHFCWQCDKEITTKAVGKICAVTQAQAFGCRPNLNYIFQT